MPPSSSDSDFSSSESEGDSDNEDSVPVAPGPQSPQNSLHVHPPDILHSSVPTNLCFHPEQNLVLITDHDGQLELYGYTNEKTWSVGAIKNSGGDDVLIRDLKFSSDGATLYCGRTDGKMSVVRLGNGGFGPGGGSGDEISIGVGAAEEQSQSALNTIVVIDERTIGIGDDDGDVTIWDLRSPTRSTKISLDSSDSVAQLISDDEGRTLVAALSDGHVVGIKTRGRKIETRSEPYDSSFTSLGSWKGGTKVGVGDSSGQIYWFDWGNWGYHSDIYKPKGGKSSKSTTGTPINCMLPLTDQIGVLGLDDGSIRAHYFFPHQPIGIVGSHQNKLPVEKLDISWDGKLVGSVSHDNYVKFWNMSWFQGWNLDTENQKTSSSLQNPPQPVKSKNKKLPQNPSRHLPSSNSKNKGDFFNDLL